MSTTDFDAEKEGRAAAQKYFAKFEARRPKVPREIEHLVSAKAAGDVTVLQKARPAELRRLHDYEAKLKKWTKLAVRAAIGLQDALREDALIRIARVLYGEVEAEALQSFLRARTHVKPRAPGEALVEAMVMADDLERIAEAELAALTNSAGGSERGARAATKTAPTRQTTSKASRPRNK